MNLAEANLALSQKLPIDDPTVRARLDRAYDIVRMPGYEITRQGEITWSVEKLSTSLFTDESATYTIIEDDNGKRLCSCPDAQERARAGLCKHVLAVALLEIMEEDNT